MHTEIFNYKRAPHTVVDFGVTDAKGRAVGFVRWSSEYDVAQADGTGGAAGGAEPGHYYALSGISARNGVAFGASEIRVDGRCQATVEQEFAARVERARRAAVKKFAQA